MRLIRTKPTRKRYLGLGLLLALFTFGATSLSVEGASSIAQGFRTTDSNVVPGAIVGLTKGASDTVELSQISNTDQMIGVVGEESLIELSATATSVQIVTNGKSLVLVSDINGSIRIGDKITTSPIPGVGMKATESVLVIGTAQDDLVTSNSESRTVTDKDGKKQTVHIGAVPIQVDKVFYEPRRSTNSFLPPAFQDFANSLAGRQVSPIRVMIAGALVILLFVTVIILLYSSVRSSILSIGRNPLSERSVYKGLLQVGLTVLGVMIFTTVVIYLILTT